MKKICSKKGPGERWYAKTFFKFFSSLRINLDLANKAKLTGTFDVTDDALSKKNIGLNVFDIFVERYSPPTEKNIFPSFPYFLNPKL